MAVFQHGQFIQGAQNHVVVENNHVQDLVPIQDLSMEGENVSGVQNNPGYVTPTPAQVSRY